MAKTSLKNQPGHPGAPLCPGFFLGLEWDIEACTELSLWSQKTGCKPVGALPPCCLMLDWVAQWTRYLSFPKFVCCTSGTNHPESGQGGREAAVFQGSTFEGDVGQTLLLAWGSGGNHGQLQSNAQGRAQTCSPKEQRQCFGKRTVWGFRKWVGRRGLALILLTVTCGATCRARWFWHKKASQSCWRNLADELSWCYHCAAA